MPWQPTDFNSIPDENPVPGRRKGIDHPVQNGDRHDVPLHQHAALEQTFMLEVAARRGGKLRRGRFRVAAGRQHPCRAHAPRSDLPTRSTAPTASTEQDFHRRRKWSSSIHFVTALARLRD